VSPRARLRSFYFFYYAGVGVTLPYLGTYLKALGLTGAQMGYVQMIGPLLSVPLGLVWALAADRRQAPTALLRLACGLTLLVTLPFPWMRGWLGVFAVLAAAGVTAPAIVPLVDAVAVETLKGDSYPRTRLFGSLGYVVVAQGLGLWLSARGDRPADVLVPAVYVACVAVYAAVAWALPSPHPTRSGSLEHPLEGLRALLGDARVLGLMVVCALHWGLCSPYHMLYGVLVKGRELPASLIGLGMALGVVTEVLVLFFAPAVESRFSVRALLGVSFAMTALRWGLLSRAQGALGIVGLQVLHGFTFGLFWMTAVRALSAYVPAQHRATGQALFGAVVFGLGGAVGAQVTGMAFDRASVETLFLGAAVLELVPAAVVLLEPWRLRPRVAAGP
jgi:PPP family 3-phenylpropionic acid transporter